MVFQEIPFTDWNFLDEYKLRNCLLVEVVVPTVPCTFPYLLSCSLPGPEYHKGYHIALQSNRVEWRQVLIKFAFNVQIFKSSLSASCLLSHVPFRPTGWREFLISVLSTSLWRYGYLFSICWHFRFMSFPIIIWQIIIKTISPGMDAWVGEELLQALLQHIVPWLIQFPINGTGSSSVPSTSTAAAVVGKKKICSYRNGAGNLH